MTYDTGLEPASVQVGDFNANKHLDIVTINLGNSSAEMLLYNDTVGFKSGISLVPAGGSSLRSLAVGDVNDDNLTDFIVINYGTRNIGVLRGNGLGAFLDPTMYPLDFAPHIASLANFDDHGHLDIAVVNRDGQNVSLLLGFSNGSFVLQDSRGDRFPWSPCFSDSVTETSPIRSP